MKNWIRISLLCIACTFIAIYFNACASTGEKKSLSTNGKKEADTSGGYQYYDHYTLQITSVGENDQAVFLPDMSSIYFVSWNRPSHSHSQIYAYSLKAKSERRITHSDGSIQRVGFDSSGKNIVYSSTTDELKENGQLLKKMIADYANTQDPNQWKQLPGGLPPFEVYLSRTDGNDIKRLTYSNNYDSEAFLTKSQLYFSSVRSGQVQIYAQNLNDGKATPLTHTPDSTNHFPSVSPDQKKIVWSRQSTNSSTSHLILSDINGKNEKILTSGDFQHTSPSWHPTLPILLFSSNRSDGNNFDLYSLDVTTQCLKRLTFTNKYNEFSPSFSPDGKSILFTSNATQLSQIFLMKYNPPEPCMGEVL